MVELSEVVGGAIISSYAVVDKVQEAEIDPGMIVEEDFSYVEPSEHCLVCGGADETHELMYCDGCDKAIHVFCAGFDESPDVWYCETCLIDLENDLGLPGMASAMRRRRRRRTPNTLRTRRRNDAVWARVWQEVSRRLDLDLDFPFDDDNSNQRTEEQQREFSRWQRRFEVAGEQGATSRLRDIANARLQREPVAISDPESQEELRAWNAFDKARESQDASATIRRRKRKATSSPVDEPDSARTEQPTQKRPRLRRPPVAAEPLAAESSHEATQRNGNGPTFLSSLLREVETKPISASSPGVSENHNGHYSPRDSSPEDTPSSSECGTPLRALSRTPPPHRPTSPPLSSTIVPISPMSATFSPFSPANRSHGFDQPAVSRGRRRPSMDELHENSEEQVPLARASSTSPTRNLSFSAKNEIQRMVKLSLGSRYRDKEITKDQYTTINRDVSRRLYELVGDASALTDQIERGKWQGVADEEVQKAVAAVSVAVDTAD